jgi:hypothetical protein
MPRLTTRGIATAQAIGNRQPFTTSGSLCAKTYGQVNPVTSIREGAGPWDCGRLSESERDAWNADMSQIVYVVYSYATPIAWVTADGSVHRVAQKFSVTTSKHQGNLYLLTEV